MYVSVYVCTYVSVYVCECIILCVSVYCVRECICT